MGRPKNTDRRRAEIVAALGVVIAREGYAGASVAAVARAAGLAPGLVHYHFARKLDILVALVEQLAARVAARAAARLEASGPAPLERLLAVLDAHLALGPGADPRAVAAWVAVGSEATREPAVRRVYRAAIARRLRELTALVRACLRAAGRSVRPAPEYAAALAAAIEGAYQLAVAAPGALPRGFAAPTLRRMARDLVAPAGRAATGSRGRSGRPRRGNAE